MLKQVTKKAAAFACALALAGGCLTAAPANSIDIRAYAAGYINTTSGGVSTNNVGKVDTAFHIFDNQDKRVYSYLYESSAGYITRVEYAAVDNASGLIVEEYNMKTGAVRNKKYIEFKDAVGSVMSDIVFGGFFAGKDYNYVVIGQNNESQKSIPVFCVIRYTKDFNSYKWTYLADINTTKPFDSGSCRMTEANGKLYVHTCHEMYKSDDGHNHQANMSYVLDEATLTFEQKHYVVSWPDYSGRMQDAFGYSSHSFDQFIASEGNVIYAYDHGDANPRTLRLHKYVVDTANTAYGNLSYSDLVTIPIVPEDSTYNYTGILTGGMQLSANNVLIGVKMADMSALSPSNKVRDVYVIIAPKNSIGGSNIAVKVKLTGYTSGDTCSAPRLVKINSNKFAAIWKETTSGGTNTRIAIIDENGRVQGSIVKTNRISVSGCDPIICSDGLIRWYATSNSSPIIYAVDPNAPSDFSGGSAVEVKSGDADGNGSVELFDVTRLQQYLTHWNVTVDAVGADANGDGVINIKDVGLLQQFLAGWKVKLGK